MSDDPLRGYEREFFDEMARRRVLGPGCGSAEFERDDWREQAAWRMRLGYRPVLASRYQEWLRGREAARRDDAT